MFTYTLSGKVIENGQNRITVDYTNETLKFSETFFFASKEELDSRITNTIARLKKVIALNSEIVIANYVKAEKPTEVVKEATPLELAEQVIWELKRKIELGVMKETDQEFVDAIEAYKIAASK